MKKFNFASVSVASFAHFVHDIFSHFLSPVLPIIISALGINYSQAGLLSVFHRAPSFLNPVIGQYSSDKPLHLIMSVAIVVTASVMCFITVAPTYVVLCLLIFCMGISSSFFHVTAPVVIRKYSGWRIGTGMSFFMVGGEVARGVGPVLILTAISLWGIGKVYYLIPLAVISATAIFIYFAKKEKKARTVAVDFGAGNNKASTVSEIAKLEKEESFLTIVSRMKLFFFSIFVIMIAKASIAAVLNAFLPAYLTSIGLSLWVSGIALTVLQISAAVGTAIAGPISDKFGKNNVLLVITALSPVLMFLFLFSSGFFTMILIAVTGFVAFASSPVVMAYVQEANSKNPTVSNSIYMMIDFATILCALLFTGVAGDFLGLKSGFILCGFISCFGFPFVILLRKVATL